MNILQPKVKGVDLRASLRNAHKTLESSQQKSQQHVCHTSDAATAQSAGDFDQERDHPPADGTDHGETLQQLECAGESTRVTTTGDHSSRKRAKQCENT